MKTLPISVYKHKRGDCSNGGVSSFYNELLLECEDGYIDVDENNPPENLVRIVTRHLFGREYKHIEPIAPKRNDCVGYMFGGCFAYSGDSRFRAISEYPLPIHDRQETQELYDMLTND